MKRNLLILAKVIFIDLVAIIVFPIQCIFTERNEMCEIYDKISEMLFVFTPYLFTKNVKSIKKRIQYNLKKS